MIRTEAEEAVLRPATVRDLPAVERLLAASDLPREGVADPVCRLIIAESAGTVVGVVGLEVRGDWGLLRSTAVAAEWRGRGLGRRLVARMIADAAASGIASLFLLTTTAEQYFPSFGFRITRRDEVPEPLRASAEFRGACPSTASVMCLRLGAPAASPGV